MSSYYCHLGNTPELSFGELRALLPDQSPELIMPTIVSVTLADNDAAKELLSKTGGTVKIYRKIDSFPSSSITEILTAIAAHLLSQTDGKVTFGFAQIGKQAIAIQDSDIKHALKERNIASRYVDSVPPYGVAAAVLLKDGAQEITLINTGTKTIVTTTVAVQDINDWTKRDRQKPYADRKKGMLPPKVARMMVNIGLSLLPPTVEAREATLLDPFMGSGTILMEALLRGTAVQGHDLDAKSVSGTKENIDWLLTEYDLHTTHPHVRQYEVMQRDAAQRFDSQTQPWVDLIVTEPFLGKPTPAEHELKNMFLGLHRLYLGAFKNWTTMLKNGSSIVIVFPLVKTKHHTYSLEDLIDKLAPLGYSIVSQPIVYSRPQAIVQRQIHFLRFTR